MESAAGPVYEFTFSVNREVVAAFDAWLAQHVEETLQTPGIAGIEVYRQADDDAGHAKRVVHYAFFDDNDLDQFLASPGDAASKLPAEEFGVNVETTQRILRHTGIARGGMSAPELCLNCGTALSGQYCGNCGQRAVSRLISVWELLRDAFGDLLEFDSRLWRTLIPLTVRPGQLTRDYLEGRRARYMPPFRMYLVLSIVFFLIAFFDPREELGILFAPNAEPTAEEVEEAADAQQIRDEVLRDLADEGIVVANPGNVEGDAEETSQESAADSRELTVRFSNDDDSGQDCDVENIDISDWPPWLSSRLTAERLKVACDRVLADDGSAFSQKLLDNVPAALFLLLPLMALVLKLLYPLSKRYYVEHLLFVVHYHAFVFLILSLQVLFARLGALARVPETPIDLTIIAVTLYVPVYLYKALRRVYGQSALFASLKFLVLMLAYFSGLLMILALVALFAAFSI